MKHVVFDIETIPQDEAKLLALAPEFTAPANLKDPEKIAAAIEEGFSNVRPDAYRVELDRKRAIDEILRLARSGDTVLIAGKGHETYQEFEDTVVPFDDRVYARETLETLGFRSQEAPEGHHE